MPLPALSCGRTGHPQPVRLAQGIKGLSPQGAPLESLSTQKCLERRPKGKCVLSTCSVLTQAHSLLGMASSTPIWCPQRQGWRAWCIAGARGLWPPAANAVGAESLSGAQGAGPRRVQNVWDPRGAGERLEACPSLLSKATWGTPPTTQTNTHCVCR